MEEFAGHEEEMLPDISMPLDDVDDGGRKKDKRPHLMARTSE